MRDLAFAAVMLGLLPIALVRPFVGVLLWCWISFMNPHHLMWGFSSDVPWALLAFCATVLGCWVAGEPRRLALNWATALLGIFLVCITLTSIFALAPPELVWPKWEIVAKVIVGAVLTSALLSDRQRIHAMVWLMVLALGFFGVKGGLFTLMTGGGNIVLGPPVGPIADRNHLAAALLISLPLMNYLRLQSAHRLVRFGLLAAMVLTLFSVVGSQSRGALIGLVATAAFLWLRSPNKVVSGIAIAAAVAAAVLFMPANWWERMDSIETFQQDASAMGRVEIWGAILRLVEIHPLTGTGFLGFYLAPIVNTVAPGMPGRAAHSIWFEVLGEHGIPAFVVWAGIIVAGAAYSVRIAQIARGRPELRWAGDLARMSQVAFVAYITAGSLLSLSYWDLFWTLIVVLGATHRLVREAVVIPQQPWAATASRAVPAWRSRAAGGAAT